MNDAPGQPSPGRLHVQPLRQAAHAPRPGYRTSSADETNLPRTATRNVTVCNVTTNKRSASTEKVHNRPLPSCSTSTTTSERRRTLPRTAIIAAALATAAGPGVTGCGDGDGATPTIELLETYTLTADLLYPESGDYDPVTTSFYVSSISQGRITRVTATGDQETFHEEAATYGTVGLRIDAAARMIWVCANLGDGEHELWGVSLETGARERRVALADAFDDATCNDVAPGPDGGVYVTDSNHANIYRYDPSQDTVAVWATDPAFGAGGLGLNLNGLAFSADGAWLLTANYQTTTLFRVSVADPTDVTAVELDGDLFRGTGPIVTGPDGMRMDGDVLVVAMIDRWATVTPADDTWAAATVSRYTARDGTSAVALAEGQRYGIRSDIIGFVLERTPALPFEIYRLDDGN